jgi:hypothetical protein
VLSGELASRAERCTDDDGVSDLPSEHVWVLRGLVHDLVEANRQKIDEHQIDNGSQTTHCRSNGHPDEAGFGYRHISNPFRTELTRKSRIRGHHARPRVFAVGEHIAASTP